jgi:hypothetical protein
MSTRLDLRNTAQGGVCGKGWGRVYTGTSTLASLLTSWPYTLRVVYFEPAPCTRSAKEHAPAILPSASGLWLVTMNPTEPYHTQPTSSGPRRAPGRGPVAHVGRVHAAGGVHEGVLRLDDHLGRGHHVRERRRARVALRQPQAHRNVVLHALRQSFFLEAFYCARVVAAAHRLLLLRPAQAAVVLGRRPLRTSLCCYR